MNFRSRWKEDPEINLIPLIDVLLVILIFLMVTTTYSKYAELQINLPTADAEKQADRPNEINITVNAQGQYTIDRKPLEAILAEAKAEQANAEAALAKANNDVTRYTPLVAKQAVSKQELDNAMSARDAATAQVAAARAAVEKATLDLGYTRVTAPISGLRPGTPCMKRIQ